MDEAGRHDEDGGAAAGAKGSGVNAHSYPVCGHLAPPRLLPSPLELTACILVPLATVIAIK